jgi:hypothetical protein
MGRRQESEDLFQPIDDNFNGNPRNSIEAQEGDDKHIYEQVVVATSALTKGMSASIHQVEGGPVRSRSRGRRHSLNVAPSKGRRGKEKDTDAANNNNVHDRSRSRGRIKNDIVCIDRPKDQETTKRDNTSFESLKSNDIHRLDRSRSRGRKNIENEPLIHRSPSRGRKNNDKDPLLDRSGNRGRKTKERDPPSARSSSRGRKINEGQHEPICRGRITTMEVEHRARSLSRGRRIAEGALSIVSAALAGTVSHKLNQSRSGSLTSEPEEHICNGSGNHSQRNGGWISRFGFRSSSKLTFDRTVDDNIPLATEDSITDVDFEQHSEVATVLTTSSLDHSRGRTRSASAKNNKNALRNDSRMESDAYTHSTANGSPIRSRRRRDSIRSSTHMKSVHDQNDLFRDISSPSKSKVATLKIPCADYCKEGGNSSSLDSPSHHRLPRPPASPRRKVTDEAKKIVVTLSSTNEESVDISTNMSKKAGLQLSFLELLYDETNSAKEAKNNISTTSLKLNDLDLNEQSETTSKISNRLSNSFVTETINQVGGKKERRRNSCTNFPTSENPKQSASSTRKSHKTNSVELSTHPAKGREIMETLLRPDSTIKPSRSHCKNTYVSPEIKLDEPKKMQKGATQSSTCENATSLKILTSMPKSKVSRDCKTIGGATEPTSRDMRSVEFASNVVMSASKESKKKSIPEGCLVATTDDKGVGKSTSRKKDESMHVRETGDKRLSPSYSSPSRKSTTILNSDTHKLSKHSRRSISSTTFDEEGDPASDKERKSVRPCNEGIVVIRSRSPSKSNRPVEVEDKTNGKYSTKGSLIKTEQRHDSKEMTSRAANASPRRSRRNQDTDQTRASINESSSCLEEIPRNGIEPDEGKRQLSDASKPPRTRKNCFDWIESEFQNTTSASATSPTKQRQSKSPSKCKQDSFTILTACSSISILDDTNRFASSSDKRSRSRSRARAPNTN